MRLGPLSSAVHAARGRPAAGRLRHAPLAERVANAGSYSGARPAQTVADCLVERWRKTRVIGSTAMPGLKPTATGLSLSLTIDKALDQVAAIDNQGSGARTRLCSLCPYFGDKAVQIVDVEACQRAAASALTAARS